MVDTNSHTLNCSTFRFGNEWVNEHAPAIRYIFEYEWLHQCCQWKTVSFHATTHKTRQNLITQIGRSQKNSALECEILWTIPIRFGFSLAFYMFISWKCYHQKCARLCVRERRQHMRIVTKTLEINFNFFFSINKQIFHIPYRKRDDDTVANQAYHFRFIKPTWA